MKKLESVVLRDICDLLNRGISPKYSEEGNLILNQKCIRNNVVSLEVARYSSLEKKVSPEKYLKLFDILVNSTGTGTLGRTAQIKSLDQPTLVDTHITIVRPNDKVDKVFIALQLALKEPEIVSLGKGATNQQELGRTELGGIELLLPPLAIQRKIAFILSAYDDLIANNLKRIKLLEELAQRTYDEWFVKFRINGKQQNINAKTGIPDGWSKIKLGEAVDYLSRGVSPKYVEENGIAVINQKCIRNGIISLTQSRLTSSGTKIAQEKYLQLYDVLVNSTGAGTLGRVAQVTHLNQNIIVDTHVSIIRANKTIISPILLGFLIKSQENVITNMGKGSTNQLELSRNDLKDLVEVIVPMMEYQQQFETLIEPTLKLSAKLTAQNLLLKESRDILLPRLMNNEIEVDQ
ncbi:MAG: restriction endonuclease subunit S [bacterium]|nr:restriction endonuclease subunit S [bacterium]